MKQPSKTPRTDRQVREYIHRFGETQQYVKIGFARQLERQLRKANSRLLELELDIRELKAKEDELNDLNKWLEGR